MPTIPETRERLKAESGLEVVPADVLRSVERSANAIRGDEVRWQEAMAFFNNDQYVFINAVDNTLDRLETREGGQKPRFRHRLTRNRMTMQVMNEASFLAGRWPEYECQAPNQDPSVIAQAKLGEQALSAEHENLALEQVEIDILLYSMLTGAGFTWPYWDPQDGEWLGETEDGEGLWLGRIKVARLHQGEVLWHEGMTFEESPWHCVRKAQPVEQVKKYEGYIGPERLATDARAGMWERPGTDRGDMCFVFNYLERPCPEHPKGRWLTFAGGHQIREPRDYPREKGGLCIHQLPWIPQPAKHRALGAGEQLVDVQRTWNRTINQIITWKNLVLVPQMKAPVGSLQKQPSDESGVVWEYRPIAGKEPEWREVPEIPVSLFKMLDLCVQDFDHILGFEVMPPGIESGSAVDARRGYAMEARSLFVKNMARHYGSQGTHLLELIQKHYTEPQLLEVQGRFGVDRIPDFVGRKLGKPGQVRVKPASIEPRTKAAMEARLMGYAERGWIHPHQVMAAINGGVAGQLIDDFELDIAAAHRHIRQLLAIGGQEPDPYFQRAMEMYQLMGGSVDELPPHLVEQLPGLPMAEEFHEHVIHIDVLQQWMKTTEWEAQPPLVKQATRNLLAQHEFLEDQKAAKAMFRQTRRAEMLGLNAAGRAPGQKAAPSPASQETLVGAAQQPAGE